MRGWAIRLTWTPLAAGNFTVTLQNRGVLYATRAEARAEITRQRAAGGLNPDVIRRVDAVRVAGELVEVGR